MVVAREHSTECVVALKNVKHKERFLCINSKGKIKTQDVSLCSHTTQLCIDFQNIYMEIHSDQTNIFKIVNRGTKRVVISLSMSWVTVCLQLSISNLLKVMASILV